MTPPTVAGAASPPRSRFSAPWLSLFPERPAPGAPGPREVMGPVHARGTRWMSVFVAFHLLVAAALAGVHGTWGATLAVAPALALPFFLAAWLAPRSAATRVLAGVVLQGFCALHIFQMQGMAEMHFWFFTATTMMIVYQDWAAPWPGVLAIIAQHTLFAHWHNLGMHPGGVRFFEPERMDALTLALHYGIALVQVGVASCWAHGLRGRTLAVAARQAELERANALLRDQAAELEAANEQLQESAVELEAQSAQLQEQAGELEATNDELRALNDELETQTAAALEARRRVAEVLDSTSDGFVALDRAWRITLVNPRGAALLGKTPDELLGREHGEVWPETRGTELERRYRRAMESGVPEEFEAWDERGERCGEIRVFPTSGGLGLFFRDVTAARAAERALREAETRFRRVVDSDIVGVVFWTAGGGITNANDAFLEMLGYPRDALERGEIDWKTLTPPEWAGTDARVIAELRETGRTAPFEKEYLHRDGRRVPVLVHGATYADTRDAGVAIVLDLSARRRAEAERDALLGRALEARAEADAARRQAEAANEAKSRFLATMSHELRTPLNAIGGYADLLRLGIQGPVTAKQADFLARIQRAQRHLLGLINDVLDFARIEAGRVELNLADFPLEIALDEVEAMVAPQAEERRLRLHRLPGGPPATVRADPDRTRQIVLNLLSNAVKFTGEGGEVELGWTLSGGAAEVRVRDTGCGIPAERLESVFEPFVQLDADLTRTAQGTGLGLSISRELARAMGGDLVASSEVGVGSTFTLRLPLASVGE